MIRKTLFRCRTIIRLAAAGLAADLVERAVQQALLSANKRRLFVWVSDTRFRLSVLRPVDASVCGLGLIHPF